MISVEERFLPEQHAICFTLKDSFGKEHKLVVPLYLTREVDGQLTHEPTDPDGELEKVKAMMEEQEIVATRHAFKRGHVKEDCGCGPGSATSANTPATTESKPGSENAATSSSDG